MRNLKNLILLLCFFFFSTLSAQNIIGTKIGGDPTFSWEDGGQDFFVMFNSNIDNKVTLYGEDETNPQGDSCVESSSFTLESFNIPDDAIVEKAYLIWMGAVDPDKMSEPTDNSVHLKFVQSSENPIEYAQDITAGETGKLLGDPNSFEFESITFTDEVEMGCTETGNGNTIPDQKLGYFTYRVDVTDFFNKIQEANSAAEKSEEGMYFGTYTFSDLDCTEHDYYRCKTTMVSAWAIFFVYRSQNIKPKKLYFYNGLAFVQGDVSVAKVSGFELPQYPVLRLTLMIAEGDPKLIDPSLPMEKIALYGKGAQKEYLLRNECNPPAVYGSYVEVFNSVSSIVNWNPDAEENNRIKCVSGPEDESVNYGIDVDSFLLDSEKEVNLQEHLHKGNTSMEISLFVNQDAIFTNFMVLSVDNKGANFDIPEESSDTTKSKLNFPKGREKHFCGCPASDDSKVKDYYCEFVNISREFYYFIKVQNWGDSDAENIVVSDELDPNLDYIPGTTEMATDCSPTSDVCTDWTLIPDKEGDKFPLSGEGYKISSKMEKCDQTSLTCSDTILVRYKVKPKPGVAKNYTFSNIALIKESGHAEAYKTNLSYPLKLKPSKCVPDTVCPSPTQAMCGGERVDANKECGEPGLPNCPNGYVCQDYKCVDDPSTTCTGSSVDFALGKNTPQADNSIIIPKNNANLPLIVGQFTLKATNCEELFNLDSVIVHFDTKNDANFTFNEYELIYDADGNGVYDEAVDIIVSNEQSALYTNYIKFFLNDSAKKFSGKLFNYFLIRTKFDYSKAEIPLGTSFHFYIESENSITVSDLGETSVSSGSLEFATFTLEPTGEYFIVSPGEHDPGVPPIAQMNDDIPVLQLRTKSIGQENEIASLKVKIPPSSAGYVKFGEEHGITGISLWIDTNQDGRGDIKVAEKTAFELGSASSITFTDFTQPITYVPERDVYLVINVDFDMVKREPPMRGKIQIPKGGIKLKNDATFVELPINSKEFAYDCKEGDASCQTESEGKKSGGGCSTIDVESGDAKRLVLVLTFIIASIAVFLVSRKRSL